MDVFLLTRMMILNHEKSWWLIVEDEKFVFGSLIYFSLVIALFKNSMQVDAAVERVIFSKSVQVCGADA